MPLTIIELVTICCKIVATDSPGDPPLEYWCKDSASEVDRFMMADMSWLLYEVEVEIEIETRNWIGELKEFLFQTKSVCQFTHYYKSEALRLSYYTFSSSRIVCHFNLAEPPVVNKLNFEQRVTSRLCQQCN